GIAAQNWDWSPGLYAWPGVVTMKPKRGLATLTYHYPGLWACCGVNAAGLAPVWTGSAYYPAVPPRAGVPTYLLIAELLGERSVDDALALLKRVPRAGSFVFLLADPRAAAVVEATPGAVAVRPVTGSAARANHFV